ncbi:uncharacterized protein LOC126481614 [Schistocerca serialis cubense]|uniref:uncharacterized protein LOC126481614 n=1 Tax=Schistocerca serialis cubense TaxID=2023355 RepID=UPI00214E5FFA|nr:uncharacterized protein LOC126481614 [Schistocerca serialis cubense]
MEARPRSACPETSHQPREGGGRPRRGAPLPGVYKARAPPHATTPPPTDARRLTRDARNAADMRTMVTVLLLAAALCGVMAAPAPAPSPSLPLVYGYSTPLQYAAALGYTGPLIKPATTIYTGYSAYPYTYGYGYGYPSYYYL